MSRRRAIKVGAVQLGSGPDVERNLEAVERTVKEAAERGAELAEHEDGEGVAVATVAPEHVDEVRRQLPGLRHRRLM